MTDQKTRIVGLSPEGTPLEQALHQHEEGDPAGALVHTLDHTRFTSNALPFLNDTNGANMAVAVTFGSNASVIHDGGTTSSKLTGTADSQQDSHLKDSGESFSTIEIGMGVHNTSNTTYAMVTAKSANDLTLDANIFPVGNENYTLDPVWIGAATLGAWVFTGGDITITAGDELHRADFSTVGTIAYTASNFTAFTGKIDLGTYSASNHSIQLCFLLSGVLTGEIITLDDFIDTGNFSQQAFAIAMSVFAIPGTFDGMAIILHRTGGPKIAVDFDDFQLEVSGTPVEYRVVTPTPNKKLYVDRLIFSLADNVTSIVTGSTTTYPTVAGLAYDAILGVSKLTNGIVFSRIEKGVTLFSVNLKQLADALTTGGIITNVMSDGTNTYLTIEVNFTRPLILGPNNRTDYLALTINDDLSGLLHFQAVARGGVTL